MTNDTQTTESAFDAWCKYLGWQVIKTAMQAMETDEKPSDKDLAQIIRNACNDYISDKVGLPPLNQLGITKPDAVN